MTTVHHFLAFSLLALFCVPCTAQQACSGTLTGTFAGITVSGGAECTLSDATVTGSVSVSGGGMLTTLGQTQILGSIQAMDAGNIVLREETTVSGSVSFTGSGSSTIDVGSSVIVTSISLQNSGILILRGTAGSVSSTNSGAVDILGGSISGGGLLVEQGTGDVTLCGANISGGVSLVERSGDLLAVSSGTCDPSIITGSIGSGKSTGDILLTGATISQGDLGIAEQTGRIEISQASVGDILIEKSSGNIILSSVTTDSDVSILDNNGDVQISDSSFAGDVGVTLNAAVDVQRSSFALEDASFKLNSGPVKFIENSDVSVSFAENNDVEIRDNTIVGASVTSNTGGVSIVDNTFSTLSCADNSPAPVGSGNTVTVLADGQCSTF